MQILLIHLLFVSKSRESFTEINKINFLNRQTTHNYLKKIYSTIFVEKSNSTEHRLEFWEYAAMGN